MDQLAPWPSTFGTWAVPKSDGSLSYLLVPRKMIGVFSLVSEEGTSSAISKDLLVVDCSESNLIFTTISFLLAKKKSLVSTNEAL